DDAKGIFQFPMPQYRGEQEADQRRLALRLASSLGLDCAPKSILGVVHQVFSQLVQSNSAFCKTISLNSKCAVRALPSGSMATFAVEATESLHTCDLILPSKGRRECRRRIKSGRLAVSATNDCSWAVRTGG